MIFHLITRDRGLTDRLASIDRHAGAHLHWVWLVSREMAMEWNACKPSHDLSRINSLQYTTSKKQ